VRAKCALRHATQIDDSFFFVIVAASTTDGIGLEERRVLQFGLSTALLCIKSLLRMLYSFFIAYESH